MVYSLTHTPCRGTFEFTAKPFIFLPGALWSHEIRKYQEYLRNVSSVAPSQYYVNAFETINATHSKDDDDDDDGMMDDDAWINPPDDLVLEETMILKAGNVWMEDEDEIVPVE